MIVAPLCSQDLLRGGGASSPQQNQKFMSLEGIITTFQYWILVFNYPDSSLRWSIRLSSIIYPCLKALKTLAPPPVPHVIIYSYREKEFSAILPPYKKNPVCFLLRKQATFLLVRAPLHKIRK